MIVFADLHLDSDSAEVCLGQVLPGIRAAVDEHGDKSVAMLGDFWDLRYRVEVRLLNAVRDTLRAWVADGIRVRFLPGNHDQVDIAGRNALEVLGDIPGVSVYTQPMSDVDGVWVPFRRDPREVLAYVARAVDMAAGRPLTCFLHHGIQGSVDNYGNADASGVVAASLPFNVTVLAGHYHRAQTLAPGRVHYIGSPRQVTAREAGQPKGYALWDGRTIRWVHKVWGPRYHVVVAGADGGVVLPADVRAGDDVRVTAPEGACAAVARQLDAAGVRHTVTAVLAEASVRLSVGAEATVEQYAQAYVEREAGDLDKQKLMAGFRQIYRSR